MPVSEHGTVVVIGGTSDIGKALAAHYAAKGFPVIVTSRDIGRAENTAREVGATCRGLAVDLSEPHSIQEALRTVTDVSHLALGREEKRGQKGGKGGTKKADKSPSIGGAKDAEGGGVKTTKTGGRRGGRGKNPTRGKGGGKDPRPPAGDGGGQAGKPGNTCRRWMDGDVASRGNL